MRASKCLMLTFFFNWFHHLREFLFVLYSCLALHFMAFQPYVLSEKNDSGQFLHVSCLFWSSSFRLKNILLEAHTWSNKSFSMSERRIWRFQGSTTLRIVSHRDMHMRASDEVVSKNIIFGSVTLRVESVRGTFNHFCRFCTV